MSVGENHRIVRQTHRPRTIRKTILGGACPHSQTDAWTQALHRSQGRRSAAWRTRVLPSCRAGVREYEQLEERAQFTSWERLWTTRCEDRHWRNNFPLLGVQGSNLD